jgi:putative DNA primase/helicase
MLPNYYDKLAERVDAMPETKKTNGHANDSDSTVGLCRGADVKMEPITWLWDGWLACGKLHVLAGVPGLGKTTLSLALAATISKGGLWPDGSKCREPGNVLIWSGEDGIEDTLAPRLAAMGADLSRVYFVRDVTEYTKDSRRIVREFDPAQDMPRLVAAAEPIGAVRLLIIDPVSLSVAGDSNKNSEVRRGLAPLDAFAERMSAAVVGISHFSKGTAGKDPLDRVTGSLAFGAAPRLVLGAARITEQEEDGEVSEGGHVLVRIKSNIGPSGGAIEYQFDQVQIKDTNITASRIVWGKRIDGSARDILAQAEQSDEQMDERSAKDEAAHFLRTLLADGPVDASQIYREAKEAGHAQRTLFRAKQELRVEAVRDGHTRKWAWRLPQGRQELTSGNLGNLGNVGSLERQDGQGCQDGHVFGDKESGHLADRETF